MTHINPLHCIDFYKADHRRQYPAGTELVYSNLTPRSEKLKNIPDDIWTGKLVFFGLQYFIKDFLIDAWNQGFFQMPREQAVQAYQRRMDTALGKAAIATDHIGALHDLGYLPIAIRALPEATRCDIRVPVLVIYNTLPEFFWLTNYLESVMSAELWKLTTNATVSHYYKLLLMRYADITGIDASFVQFQAHDFSFRGMSGRYDAAASGAAHLLSFVGTDTVAAIDFHENYYHADADQELIGCSVPASEHSVMCMGEKASEIQTFDRFITELYPTGMVSIVSDTWDFWKVISEYTVQLKDKILNRAGKVVFRPDSGDPVKIICGSNFARYDTQDQATHAIGADCLPGQAYTKNLTRKVIIAGQYRLLTYNVIYTGHAIEIEVVDDQEFIPSAAELGAVQCLWNVFGGTVNAAGYRELDAHVGLIYGDSITLQRAQSILEQLKNQGFASNNIVFGIGSYGFQYNTRDTFGFAVKATYGIVQGQGREIFKDPVTDSGTKKSAKGLIKVTRAAGELVLHDQQPEIEQADDVMREVFRDGKLLIDESLGVLRARLAEI